MAVAVAVYSSWDADAEMVLSFPFIICQLLIKVSKVNGGIKYTVGFSTGGDKDVI